MFVDTHCHIQDTEFYPDTQEQVYAESRAANVEMICVGTDVRSSQLAVEFAATHEGCYAVVGIHPHEAATGDVSAIKDLIDQAAPGVIVGIGEIGLDYFYEHSPRDVQIARLRDQLELAVEYTLPVSFHVREAFDDFWPIFDDFTGVRGVMHSFTDSEQHLYEGIRRGLFVGINGISTFTKDDAQLTLYREVPLEHVVLETDAPFLTPKPFRGKMNTPAYVEVIAQHQATLRGVRLDVVRDQTTANARKLFSI